MKKIQLIVFSVFILLLCSPSLSGQASSTEFLVDFSSTTKSIPPGISGGINDLSNATGGVWKAWSDQVRPEGGLARIWLSYVMGPLAKQIQAGLHAKEAGLGVFLVVVGAPENQGGGHDKVGIPPRDTTKWANHVAKDVERLLDAGVPVEYIEIWNEPNLEGQWLAPMEEFATFFAKAGKQLRMLLPPGIKLGGPGMATAAGAAQGHFKSIAQACVREGFSPDFVSWHFYSSYPSDNERCEFGKRLQLISKEAGLPKPEVILSEWNIDLPHPTAPECDDHRAGVFYISMNSSLARTSVTHSLFFFLQDGFWESKKDYAGESVGVFTLRGGPKAVLNGMRMFQIAAEFPQVHVKRQSAPWNLTCLATRNGNKGFLLLANAFGSAEKRAHHYVDWAGVVLSDYHGKDALVRGFVSGKHGVEKLGGPKKDYSIWKEAKRLVRETMSEQKMTHRPVRVGWKDGPVSVSKVWRLDSQHSDPRLNPAFRDSFQKWGVEGPQRAAERVLEDLEKSGRSKKEVSQVRTALNKPTPSEMLDSVRNPTSGLSPSLISEVQVAMKKRLLELREEIPLMLAKHPGAALSEVEVSSHLKFQSNGLMLDLPPWSAVLVELDWENPEGGRE